MISKTKSVSKDKNPTSRAKCDIGDKNDIRDKVRYRGQKMLARTKNNSRDKKRHRGQKGHQGQKKRYFTRATNIGQYRFFDPVSI